MTNTAAHNTLPPQIRQVSFEADHQAILTHIENMLDSIKENQPLHCLSDQVKNLLPLMLEHFIEEEMHMREISYPAAPSHAMFHSEILGDVSYAFEALHLASPADLQFRLKTLMQKLLEHFSNEDFEFESFVRLRSQTAEGVDQLT